jgi:hypothetical protein
MFDSYNIPMNNIPSHVYEGSITDNDIALYAKKVAMAFGIPERVLFTKSKDGKPRKKYKDINLSEIRKAAIYKLLIESDLPYMRMGTHFGIENHASIIRIRQKAKQHLSAGDKQFDQYFSKVKDLAI